MSASDLLRAIIELLKFVNKHEMLEDNTSDYNDFLELDRRVCVEAIDLGLERLLPKKREGEHIGTIGNTHLSGSWVIGVKLPDGTMTKTGFHIFGNERWTHDLDILADLAMYRNRDIVATEICEKQSFR